MKSVMTTTALMVILALAFFANGCGKKSGSSERPKEGKAGGAKDPAPWPSASDRAEWRAEVQVGASRFGLQEAQKRLRASDYLKRRFYEDDVAKWEERVESAQLAYSRFAESKYAGRSEEMGKKILEQVVGVVDAAGRGKRWEQIMTAAQDRDLPRMWNALHRFGEEHRIEAACDPTFWQLHARACALAKQYELLAWSADNALLFDPTDGNVFFYKLLAIGNGD